MRYDVARKAAAGFLYVRLCDCKMPYDRMLVLNLD